MTRTHVLCLRWWVVPALCALLAACGDDDALPGTPDSGQGTEEDAAAGQPDAGAGIDASEPDAAVLRSIQTIGMGNNITCAVLSTGAVRCWGANEQGQVGGGVVSADPDGKGPETASVAVPTEVVGLSDAVSVDCGTAHCCARTQAGGAQCWGWNGAGELAANMAPDVPPNRPMPGAALELPPRGTAADLGGATQVAAGGAHNCALKSGGDLWCWGWNGAGQSGFDPATDPTVTVARPNGITGITYVALAHALLAEHSCAVDSEGGTLCWGLNFEGQLGDGTTGGLRFTTAAVPGLVETTALAAGQKHTCAIARRDKPDSEPSVFCWGLNNFGQAGPLANSEGKVPIQNTPIEVSGVDGAVAVAAGQSHTCALLGTGGVRCWGANNLGQLGDGTIKNHAEPGDVVGPDGTDLLTGVVQVAVGFANTCALTGEGRVYCWGDNVFGQLGQGSSGFDELPSLSPVEVPVIP